LQIIYTHVCRVYIIYFLYRLVNNIILMIRCARFVRRTVVDDRRGRRLTGFVCAVLRARTMVSSELHLHLLRRDDVRRWPVAHVLDGGATVFPDVRVRTVSHAVPSQVVVTGHGSQHVHGPGFVHALVSWTRRTNKFSER